jgi:hypothetical protein
MGLAARKYEWLAEHCDHFLTKDNLVPVKAEKTDPVQFVNPSESVHFPFLAINQSAYNVVHIDIDRVECDQYPLFEPAFDVAIYDELDIPWPTYTVPTTRHRFHAFWLLERSLPFEASPKSLQFFHDIRQKLNHVLGGDYSCNIRGAVRNPFYIKAEARSFSPQLRCLKEINPVRVQIPARTYQNNAHQYAIGNRNRTTFNVALRYFHDSNFQATFDELLSYAVRFQDLCQADRQVEPLPLAENKSIASSVRRNGHRYKVRGDYNYGAMQLPEVDWSSLSDGERQEEIRRRQQMAAEWVHDKRKDKTQAKLKAAIQQLKQDGQKVSQRAVAERAGCSLQTANRHWPTLL